MKHETIIFVPKDEAEQIRKYLETEPDSAKDCLDEDDTICHTAQFENGIEMDVKCCGIQYLKGESNKAWTEAVLFKNGTEIACTEPSDTYFGTWTLEDGDDSYTVHVKEQAEKNMAN